MWFWKLDLWVIARFDTLLDWLIDHGIRRIWISYGLVGFYTVGELLYCSFQHDRYAYFTIGLVGLLTLNSIKSGTEKQEAYNPLAGIVRMCFLALVFFVPIKFYAKHIPLEWLDVMCLASFTAYMYFAACGNKPEGKKRIGAQSLAKLKAMFGSEWIPAPSRGVN